MAFAELFPGFIVNLLIKAKIAEISSQGGPLMTRAHDQSRNAFELHQSGHSLEEIAECLDISDDRASQFIAYFQQLQPVPPESPWWYGLSSKSRVLMEELGFHSREDIEAAYQDGAFTKGHPNCLTGLTQRMMKRIKEWLHKPSQ
ncbi:hypothetical protein LG290_02955 [Halomonas sediminis]